MTRLHFAKSNFSVIKKTEKMNTYQKHYAIVGKEALALLMAARVFGVYLGTGPMAVYTDHSTLAFFEKMSNQNQKLLR